MEEQIERRVLRILRAEPRGLTAESLQGRAACRRQTLFKVVRRLVSEGRIQKIQEKREALDGATRITTIFLPVPETPADGSRNPYDEPGSVPEDGFGGIVP